MEYLNLPLLFVKFWFIEAPVRLIRYFISLNREFMHLFSLPLMIRSLFVPWKNEYRKKFVVIAIGIGFVIKTVFIAADLALFGLIILIEFSVLVFFVMWPFIIVLLLLK